MCGGPGPQKVLFAWGRSEDYWLRKSTLTRLTSKAHSPCTVWLNAKSSFVQSRQVHCQLCFCRKEAQLPKVTQLESPLSAPGVRSISPHLVPVAQRCLSSGQLQTSTGTSLTSASSLCLNTFGEKKLLTHQPLVGGSNSQSFHSHPWSCPAFVQFIGNTSALQVRPCPWRGAHMRPRPGSATM